MAHRVVDGFEIVEVDAKQREGITPMAGELKFFHQHGSVGKVSQPIELCEVGDACFSIARASNVRADAAIAAIRRRLAGELPPARLAADEYLEHLVAEGTPLAHYAVKKFS